MSPPPVRKRSHNFRKVTQIRLKSENYNMEVTIVSCVTVENQENKFDFMPGNVGEHQNFSNF